MLQFCFIPSSKEDKKEEEETYKPGFRETAIGTTPKSSVETNPGAPLAPTTLLIQHTLVRQHHLVMRPLQPPCKRGRHSQNTTQQTDKQKAFPSPTFSHCLSLSIASQLHPQQQSEAATTPTSERRQCPISLCASLLFSICFFSLLFLFLFVFNFFLLPLLGSPFG